MRLWIDINFMSVSSQSLLVLLAYFVHQTSGASFFGPKGKLGWTLGWCGFIVCTLWWAGCGSTACFLCLFRKVFFFFLVCLSACSSAYTKNIKNKNFTGESTIVYLYGRPSSQHQLHMQTKIREQTQNKKVVSTAKGNSLHLSERARPTLVSQPPEDEEQRWIPVVSKRRCRYNICLLLFSTRICKLVCNIKSLPLDKDLDILNLSWFVIAFSRLFVGFGINICNLIR